MISSSVLPDTDLTTTYCSLRSQSALYPRDSKFRTGFDANNYQKHVRLSNAKLLPKNLSLYAHFPSQADYKKLVGGKRLKQIAPRSDYGQKLYQEINLKAALFDKDRELSRIHMGGNPLYSSDLAELSYLVHHITHKFTPITSNKLDIRMDLYPLQTRLTDIDTLVALGVNHFHFKLSCNQSSFEAQEMVFERIKYASRNCTQVHLELIENQPLEKRPHLVDSVIKHNVDSVSLITNKVSSFDFHQTSFNHNQTGHTYWLQTAHDALTRHGYYHLGLHHYVLPCHSLATAKRTRNLSHSYWGYSPSPVTDQIGIGVGAITIFDSALSRNEPTLSNYNNAVMQRRLPVWSGLELNENDRVYTGLVQQILCRHQVNMGRSISDYIDRCSNTALFDYFALELEQLNAFIKNNILVNTGNGFRITTTGEHYLPSIVRHFDRYQSPQKRTEKLTNTPFLRII